MRLPGASYRGPLEPLGPAGERLRADLERDVRRLADEIGERHLGAPGSLRQARELIEGELRAAGYRVDAQCFDVAGHDCRNLCAEVAGESRPEQIVVVGAHYDTVPGCPGADDNASGVAALLALARGYVGARPATTLRFAAFVNEEPPYFTTGDMGSVRAARRSRERGENIVAMLSLESLAFYSSRPKSQLYPPPLGLLYPNTGDFIGLVSNLASRRLLRRVVQVFRERARFPSEAAVLPAWVPGASWSDQWAYWRSGYPAVMVTDTVPFRNPHYHRPSDRPETLDFDRFARVVLGLRAVIADLAGERTARPAAG